VGSALRKYSSIKIGGDAERILFLRDLMADPQISLPQPVRILGFASNILIDDRGLRGTVLIVRDDELPEPQVLGEDARSLTIKVGSGFSMQRLARWSSKRGLMGCEYMIGIPGSLGGALLQNAGANEQDLSMILVSADIFDLSNRERKILTAPDCRLSYRSSELKNHPELLVLGLELQLSKSSVAECESQVQLNLDYRRQKTPYQKPSLGSTWTRLKEGDDWLYPGQLIENAGLKGMKVGAIKVSEVHANYLINEGDATFVDAMTLIETVEQKVFEHSGIKLQREILIWSDL